MPWACSLTLDRVKCLHGPFTAAPTDFEPFFYVHPVEPEDTYASIVRTLPLNVKSSKSIKGIVIICNLMKLNQTFWSTPLASNEACLPLYIVEVEHGQLLLPKVEPQQALHIRFIPRSGGKLI